MRRRTGGYRKSPGALRTALTADSKIVLLVWEKVTASGGTEEHLEYQPPQTALSELGTIGHWTRLAMAASGTANLLEKLIRPLEKLKLAGVRYAPTTTRNRFGLALRGKRSATWLAASR